MFGVLAEPVEGFLGAQQFAGQIAKHEREEDNRKLLEDVQETAVERLPRRAQTDIDGEGAQQDFQGSLMSDRDLFFRSQPGHASDQNGRGVDDGANHAAD